MRAQTTLIFPCSVPAGEHYAEAARQRGESVVAASSLPYDESAQKFETWFYLPSVHDQDFTCQLVQAIDKYEITRIFCPVLFAYAALKRLSAEGLLSVPIEGEIPIRQALDGHRKLMADATSRLAFIQAVVGGRSPLTPVEVAAALRQSMAIFGQSDPTKIAAMMAIFADAPRGDVVEIGVLAGRTACVLSLMAQRHEIGAVLVIDHWSTAAATQRDTQRIFQETIDTWASAVPLEGFFESFIVSMLPIAPRHMFNYLTLSSREAYLAWSSHRRVETQYFGETRYAGTISVLHIDGNHDYACVREDCAMWLGHLAPGGWLILDDYVWLHGDGPRRVGDALLAERHDRVERAFVCGKALFMKLGR